MRFLNFPEPNPPQTPAEKTDGGCWTNITSVAAMTCIANRFAIDGDGVCADSVSCSFRFSTAVNDAIYMTRFQDGAS